MPVAPSPRIWLPRDTAVLCKLESKVKRRSLRYSTSCRFESSKGGISAASLVLTAGVEEAESASLGDSSHAHSVAEAAGCGGHSALGGVFEGSAFAPAQADVARQALLPTKAIHHKLRLLFTDLPSCIEPNSSRLRRGSQDTREPPHTEGRRARVTAHKAGAGQADGQRLTGSALQAGILGIDIDDGNVGNYSSPSIPNVGMVAGPTSSSSQPSCRLQRSELTSERRFVFRMPRVIPHQDPASLMFQRLAACQSI